MLSEAELATGLERAVAERAPGDGSLWVFGYGSLIWNPEFEAAERRITLLRGWHRRFCLLQRRFRGSPHRPGLVLALEPGGACRGLAFRLDGVDPKALLMPVWRREMIGSGYAARWVRLESEDGPITALTFVVNRMSDRYTGRLDEPALAEIIATGCGHLGPSAEYLFHTVAECERLGIRDPHLWRLQRLVAERLRAGTEAHGVLE